MFEDSIISKKLVPLFKPRLQRFYRTAKPFSMVSKNRLQNLHRLLHRVECDRVPGDMVEVGVAGGGSAIVIATMALESRLDRQVWLCDGFEPFDPSGPRYDEVRERLFETFRFDPARVHLTRGLFEDVSSEYSSWPIAFRHIDAGGYEPVKCCLDGLYQHVQPGGWVVIDNYGVDEDCRRAVDELLQAEQAKPSLQRFHHTQAFFQRG